MEGVEIMISTVFMTARQSFEDFPRIQSVHPLHMLPRTSHAHISNATFRSCATRIPGFMPTLPGVRQTTDHEMGIALPFSTGSVFQSANVHLRFTTLRCITSTPFGFPVVPELRIAHQDTKSKADDRTEAHQRYKSRKRHLPERIGRRVSSTVPCSAQVWRWHLQESRRADLS